VLRSDLPLRRLHHSWACRFKDFATAEAITLSLPSTWNSELAQHHARKALLLLWDHRVDSFKTIIWLHNLTISHLETDYCHSSDTPFSLLYSDFQLSGICYDSSPDLHPRRPTEAEQVFSFSVVTILVSMSAEFRLVCIFISDNTSFKRMRMKWYLTSMCLVLSW